MAAKIISQVSNKNFIDNYDRIFGKKSDKKPEVSDKQVIKTIDQVDREALDKTILERTRIALEKINSNPSLSTNPVVMMAVDHIHEELEAINKDLDSVQDVVEPVTQADIVEQDAIHEQKDLRREYSVPANKPLEKKYTNKSRK
jgi:hypothetical protein